MHQKQNALPTQTADNISDPIIYSAEDLNIPCGVFLNLFSPGYSREGATLLEFTNTQNIDMTKYVVALHKKTAIHLRSKKMKPQRDSEETFQGGN